ncbi:MAG: hypothetical protein ACOCVN_01850, partial [bacterium]
MKKMKLIHKFKILSTAVLISFTACNEEEFLKETPLSTGSLEETFKTMKGFDGGIAALHDAARRETNHNVHVTEWGMYYRTDCFYAGAPDIEERLAPHTMTPTNEHI